jgi:hypothetical protein
MAFATFAALLGGAIAGFLPGVAVGWHARPKLVQVHVTKSDPVVQARDNEIVTYVRPDRLGVPR